MTSLVFLAADSTVWTVGVLALLAAGVLMVLEWRRADRRRRAWRLVATLLALGALALLALRPAWRVRAPEGADARKEIFQPGGRVAAGAGAAIVFLRCPRVLALGEPLTVEGRIGGLPVGGSATLILEAPDGTATAADTAAADGDGEAGFAVSSAPPPAVGRFLWSLHLKTPGKNGPAPADETLGVAVTAPALPRVLVLESAPRFDTAPLRRWYASAGGTWRARTKLGQDRYRFFAASGAAGEFNSLDAELLAGFDLVLADARSLASLPPAERETLRAAVADTGLGVLTLADDALLPPAVVAPDRAWLLPWQLRPLGSGGGGDGTGPPIPADATVTAVAANDGTQHLARVRWEGLAKTVETPLPAAPFEIAAVPGQASFVRDGQGRTLAAVAMLGRGRLALTLVRETGRWQRGGDAGAFAGYWSSVLARVARPRGETAWTLAGGEGGPVFVDQPLECVRNGPADGAPPAGIRVTDGSGAPPVALAPTGDPAAPGRWRVTFWPRRAGWHRIASAAGNAGEGGALDFYVSPAGTWNALAAARRRGVAERFAARSAAAVVSEGRAGPRGTEEKPVPTGWWWGAFVLGAGFLWAERRVGAEIRV